MNVQPPDAPAFTVPGADIPAAVRDRHHRAGDQHFRVSAVDFHSVHGAVVTFDRYKPALVSGRSYTFRTDLTAAGLRTLHEPGIPPWISAPARAVLLDVPLTRQLLHLSLNDAAHWAREYTTNPSIASPDTAQEWAQWHHTLRLMTTALAYDDADQRAVALGVLQAGFDGSVTALATAVAASTTGGQMGQTALPATAAPAPCTA